MIQKSSLPKSFSSVSRVLTADKRFHKTALDEFCRLAFRKKICRSLTELQADLDSWIARYNEGRPHQGRWCFRKTPMQGSVSGRRGGQVRTNLR